LVSRWCHCGPPMPSGCSTRVGSHDRWGSRRDPPLPATRVTFSLTPPTVYVCGRSESLLGIVLGASVRTVVLADEGRRAFATPGASLERTSPRQQHLCRRRRITSSACAATTSTSTRCLHARNELRRERVFQDAMERLQVHEKSASFWGVSVSNTEEGLGGRAAGWGKYSSGALQRPQSMAPGRMSSFRLRRKRARHHLPAWPTRLPAPHGSSASIPLPH